MYFGAPVWPWRWNPPYEGVVQHLASLGLQGVELICWGSEILPLVSRRYTPEQLRTLDDDLQVEHYTPERVREYHRIFDASGLTLTNFSRTPIGLSSTDPQSRSSAVDKVARAAEVAASLGSPLITLITPYPFEMNVPPMMARPIMQEWRMDVPRDLDWKRNYDEFVEALAQCCTAAKRAGLRVALEPHPYRWMCSAQSMLRLIERTGAENLGMNLDPSHLFPCGEIPHFTVYQLGSRIYHTHFSDNDGQTNAHWRPGKGKVDWRAVVRALSDVGYTGAISIELENVPGSGHLGSDSSPELDRELQLSVAYIRATCDEEGIPTTR